MAGRMELNYKKMNLQRKMCCFHNFIFVCECEWLRLIKFHFLRAQFVGTFLFLCMFNTLLNDFPACLFNIHLYIYLAFKHFIITLIGLADLRIAHFDESRKWNEEERTSDANTSHQNEQVKLICIVHGFGCICLFAKACDRKRLLVYK